MISIIFLIVIAPRNKRIAIAKITTKPTGEQRNGFIISGSIIIESIFSIPGMGQLSFNAVLFRDYPIIMAVTTISAMLTLFGILLSDLLYALVDPRITFEGKR